MNKINNYLITLLSALLFSCAPYADTHLSASSVPTKIIPIQKNVSKEASYIKAPDTDGEHYRTQEGYHYAYSCDVIHELATKEANVEICDIDPVVMTITKWPETEVIYISKGSVLIEDKFGDTRKFKEGDMLVLPQGFEGKWIQKEKLTKIIVRHPLYWTE